MSSPQAIIIGSYCADFTIDQPLSGNGYYYYAAKDGSKTYYLATSRVTHGDGTLMNQVDATDATTIRIIDRTFVKPVNGSVNVNDIISGFKEFRFKLNWYPQIKPDFVSPSITPIDRRRYLNWEDATTTVNSTGLQPPVDAKVDRFVEISEVNNVIKDVKFSGSSLTQLQINSFNNNVRNGGTSTVSGTLVGNSAPVGAAANIDLSSQVITNLRFFATRMSPTIQVRATELKYLILKDDLDRLNSEEVTSTKQLRYLIWNQSFGRFELVDLYDPDVTTTIIQRCAFRVSSQTNYNLQNTNGSLSDDGLNLPTSGGIGPAVTLDSSLTQTVGLDAYWGFTTGSTVPITSSAVGEPNGTGISIIKTDYASMFPNTGNGFAPSVFTERSTGTQTATPQVTNNGYQDSVLSFPSLNFVDLASSGYSTSSPIPTVAGSTANKTLTYVLTNYIVDKSVEEFFTNVNVTLLKVQRYRSPTPSASPPGVTGNNEFLGFEHVNPVNAQNTPTAVAATTTTLGGGATVDLIVRDYYKFREPARATQFKFYDLGKGTEYLWQVYWPTGSTSGTFGYITSTDNANVTVVLSSSITSQDQRGWIMEYDTDMNPPGVRMRWAGSTSVDRSYLCLAVGTGTDTAPVRVLAPLGTRSNAAIFNCIMCSQIDSAGVCIPITSNPYGGGLGGTTRGITQASPTGGSPVPVTAFKIREFSAPGSPPGPRFLQYTVAQFSSPGATAPSIVYISSSPSPAPPGSTVVSDFVFTRRGTLSSTSMNNRAVFIRSSANSSLYLRAIPASTIKVELVSTNNPSDEEGFAWRIEQVTGNQVRIYSVNTLNQSPTATGRYLQSSDPSTLGSKGTTPANIFVLDPLTPFAVTALNSPSMPSS